MSDVSFKQTITKLTDFHLGEIHTFIAEKEQEFAKRVTDLGGTAGRRKYMDANLWVDG